MADKVEGYLEVGTNEGGEVVVNLPEGNTGHLAFSKNQARDLAFTLLRQAGFNEGASDKKALADMLQDGLREAQGLGTHMTRFHNDNIVQVITALREPGLGWATALCVFFFDSLELLYEHDREKWNALWEAYHHSDHVLAAGILNSTVTDGKGGK